MAFPKIKVSSVFFFTVAVQTDGREDIFDVARCGNGALV